MISRVYEFNVADVSVVHLKFQGPTALYQIPLSLYIYLLTTQYRVNLQECIGIGDIDIGPIGIR